jgi:hypothetical protein
MQISVQWIKAHEHLLTYLQNDKPQFLVFDSKLHITLC